ncbi:MAG: hydrogenase maturation protease [Verrucomicrobiota bacterium]
MSTLVIGYGNELRGDDALGPKLAALIAQRHLPGVVVLTCHQLMPELAEAISQAELVIFLDAVIDRSAGIQVQPVVPPAQPGLRNHGLQPATLLGLARDLFGHGPAAWLLTMPAYDLSFRDGLSAEAQSNLAEALDRFQELLPVRACE